MSGDRLTSLSHRLPRTDGDVPRGIDRDRVLEKPFYHCKYVREELDFIYPLDNQLASSLVLTEILRNCLVNVPVVPVNRTGTKGKNFMS